MKEVLVLTENVAKADKVINRLEMKDHPSLVLISGDPGMGKTYYTLRRTFSHGWMYYRLRATDTAKSFLQQVYLRQNKLLTGSNEIMRGSSATLENACIENFKSLQNVPLVIDEMNFATMFRKWEILEILRDFRDDADATIVMVGEHDTRMALEAYNPHFFNRCEFVQFSQNTPQDVALIIRNRSEITLDEAAYKDIIKKCKGNLRDVTKLLQELEIRAMEGEDALKG
jgi:hypothetical protein